MENASSISEGGGQVQGGAQGGRISMKSVQRENGGSAVCVRPALWQPLVVQGARSRLQKLFSDTLHCTALTGDIP